MKRSWIAVVILTVFFGASSFAEVAGLKVLVFSKTEAIRNDSIPKGIAALKALGAQRGWTVDSTEDAGRFTNAGLRPYDVVVWPNTSGNILSRAEQAAYERFHRSGKGTVAVHSGGVATQREGWPWYRKLASTGGEPSPSAREVTVMNGSAGQHPASFMFPYIGRETVAWYQLDSNPSTDAHVLLVAYDPMFPVLFLPLSWLP